jgi:hypothetical protein
VNIDRFAYIQSIVDGSRVQISRQEVDDFVEESPDRRIEVRKMLLIGQIEEVLDVIAESEKLLPNLLQKFRRVPRRGWEKIILRELIFVVRVEGWERFQLRHC